MTGCAFAYPGDPRGCVGLCIAYIDADILSARCITARVVQEIDRVLQPWAHLVQVRENLQHR